MKNKLKMEVSRDTFTSMGSDDVGFQYKKSSVTNNTNIKIILNVSLMHKNSLVFRCPTLLKRSISGGSLFPFTRTEATTALQNVNQVLLFHSSTETR